MEEKEHKYTMKGKVLGIRTAPIVPNLFKSTFSSRHPRNHLKREIIIVTFKNCINVIETFAETEISIEVISLAWSDRDWSSSFRRLLCPGFIFSS